MCTVNKFKQPKVLIVGQYFQNRTGGGITLSNLFRGWDKSRLAVLCDQIYNPDFDICETYFQMGDPEVEKKFPFNLKKRKTITYSGLLPLPTADKVRPSSTLPDGKSVYFKFLKFTGLYYRKDRFIITPAVKNWLESYSPDIIYTQLASIELIVFIDELHALLKKPLVIHIMDDWPSTISNKGIFAAYWRSKILSGWQHLMAKSSLLLSISEAMTAEYEKRYGYQFIPFHNPIDINFWGANSKNAYALNGTFKLLYAGRIGLGIHHCFAEIAEAIKEVNDEGLFEIELQIQSSNAESKLPYLKKYSFINFVEPCPYEELPRLFAAADALLLPNDFSEESISFLKYSMPTKASEFMISGSPIFLYAPPQTALSKNARQYGWAHVVNTNRHEHLVAALKVFVSDEKIRKKIAQRAMNFARKKFDSKIVVSQFSHLLTKTMLNHDE